jgi:DNA polymerase type B, organellar and viral
MLRGVRTPGKEIFSVSDMMGLDTEDDSATLMKEGKSGFQKKVCEIAAIGDNNERFFNYGNVTEFHNFLRNIGDKDLWAHNGQYDLGNLCNEKNEIPFCQLDNWEVVLVGSRFIKGRFGGYTLSDSYNLWPMPLRKIGHAFGMEKLAFDPLSRDYVFRDCEIMRMALNQTRLVCADYGITRLPRTLGSLCTKLYAALGYKNWFCGDERVKEGYYGGRVELFSAGGSGNILYTDVNSLYPFAMSLPFPTDCKQLSDYRHGWGVVTATVDIPRNTRIGLLPYRDDDGRILYPNGKFSGTWTFHELRNAEKNGARVIKFSDCKGSLYAVPYYRDFLRQVYAKRLAAKNEAENLQWKLILNNLYGRLAISGEISRSLLATWDNYDSGICYGKRVLTTQEMPLPDFTNYLHAAYVTSYARLILHRYLRAVPANDLIYCDTDSVIFFSSSDEPPFELGKELGRMKLEGIGNRCEVFAPKTYRFDDNWKAKGVPKAKAMEFILEKHAEYDLPFKLRESIQFFDRGDSRKLSVWRTVEKQFRSVYDKKRFDKGYWYPLVLNAP